MKEKINLILIILILVSCIGISYFVMKQEEKKYECSIQNINNVSEQDNNIVNELSTLNVVEENANIDNEGEKEMNNVIEVTSDNFDAEVLKSNKKVVVDFYADWCVPCQMLSPIVEEVASEVSDVKFVRINVDNVTDVAVNYGVMSIPSLVVIKDGKEINRSVGLIDKEEVKELIK